MALHKGHFHFVCDERFQKPEILHDFFPGWLCIKQKKDSTPGSFKRLIALCQVSVKIFKKQSHRVFYRKGALKNFEKFKRETTIRCPFLVKGQAWLKTLLKKDKCFMWVIQF